jgi:hypothetical protein
MKRNLSVFFVLIGTVLIGCGRFASAESVWQYGRIDSVKKSVVTTTKVWVVNTPVEEEVTKYTIAVHVQDRILVAGYDLSPSQSEPPPPEWTSGAPVKVEVVGDLLFLRSPTGSLRLKVKQRKPTGPMKPITLEEKKQLAALEAGPEFHSLIGLSKPGDEKVDEKPLPEAVPPPAAPPSTGSVTVRSTPFLSEVFVDGDSMGYTPAKIALGPGKHAFRVEKLGYRAWTKEMTITVGSELTLDATLDRK